MTNEEWIQRRLLGEGRASRFGVLSERLDEAGVGHFEVVCPPEYEGGPGVAHGGWTAAVFDEVLGHVPLLHGHYTVTAALTVEFKRPAPVGLPLLASARAERVEGRKWFLSGELALASSGAVLATASGLWIERQHASHFEGYERWLAEQGGRLVRPRVTVITLGVADLERAVGFYRDGLGWATEGIIGTEFEYGAVCFFDLDGGGRLALWPRASLAHDTGLLEGGPSATELSLGHNVGSRAEVDAVMEEARVAGATVVQPAHETFYGGYAGYFAGLDGHLWEVAWNPAWERSSPS